MYLFIYFVRKIFISKFYGDSNRIVCAYVREDNPRALASGLSPCANAQPYNNFLILSIQYFKRVTYLARRPVSACIWPIKHITDDKKNGNKRTVICTDIYSATR